MDDFSEKQVDYTEQLGDLTLNNIQRTHTFKDYRLFHVV